MYRTRITRTAALGLALAALAAPAAGAQQDVRNADQVSPPEQQSRELRSPDTIDAAAGRSTDNSPQVVFVKSPSAAPADGLDWGDAGLGAGGLLAVGLIGLGGTLVVVHRRHAHPA